ncbi:hypothetical protein AAFC00_004541 [Neodothiora populina]|uniref:Uncharacterized protein n=1 Tax=Neodothiora populina TaxID=2781224 RepID=A0ABR3P2J2_9PEZI
MSEARLRQAIELLNKVWLAYREEIYADETDQIIWKSPRRLILRSGCLEKTIKRRPGTTSPLTVLPNNLCRTPKDKTILLNFLQCNVAVRHMQCVIEWLLHDIAEKVEVAMFLLKEPPLIVTMEPDGSPSFSNFDYRHECWRVTLKSGEIFAVDLTGSQYGWTDPICPWNLCLQERCLHNEAFFVALKGHQDFLPLVAAEKQLPGFALPRVDNYYVSVQQHFAIIMEQLLHDLPTENLLGGPENQRLISEHSVIGEVRRQAQIATLATDEIWNSFSWSSVWEEQCKNARRQQSDILHHQAGKLSV